MRDCKNGKKPSTWPILSQNISVRCVGNIAMLFASILNAIDLVLFKVYKANKKLLYSIFEQLHETYCYRISDIVAPLHVSTHRFGHLRHKTEASNFYKVVTHRAC